MAYSPNASLCPMLWPGHTMPSTPGEAGGPKAVYLEGGVTRQEVTCLSCIKVVGTSRCSLGAPEPETLLREGISHAGASAALASL